MDIIAHRGYAAEYPENTLRAFCAADDADVLELDVWRCRSGELVVFHDRTVDSLTDGSGPISQFSLDDLQSLTVLGSDQHIPTLTDVLDTVPPTRPLSVEVKDPAIASEVATRLALTPHPASIASLHAEAIQIAQEVEPTVPRAYAVEDDVITGLRCALDLNCSYVHLHASLCYQPEVVEAARRFGFVVYAWTVRDIDTALALESVGVDGILTDIRLPESSSL